MESELGLMLEQIWSLKMDTFDICNDENIEGFLFVETLGSTDGKVYGSDECIKLGLFDDKVIGSLILNIDGIKLRPDVGTELGNLYGLFHGSSKYKLGCLLDVDSLEYTDGKVVDSDEGIKLVSTDGLFLSPYL